MAKPVISSVIAVFCIALCACSDSDSAVAPPASPSSTPSSGAPALSIPALPTNPTNPTSASVNDAEECLQTAAKVRTMDALEAELACPIELGDKVRIKFVGTDETYGCTPNVVGVAPKGSPREYVRVAITHGSAKEYTAVVRLENRVLKDRKSGWRNYGWPGNSPLEPCSELPMKIVSISCKVSGAPDFQPCEQDVEVLPPGLFLTEQLL